MSEGEDVGSGVGLQLLVLHREDGGQSVEPHHAALNMLGQTGLSEVTPYQEDDVEDGEAFKNIRKCRL